MAGSPRLIGGRRRRVVAACTGAVLAAVSLAAPPAAGQGETELIVNVTHRARALHPGEIVVLNVRTSEAPAALEASRVRRRSAVLSGRAGQRLDDARRHRSRGRARGAPGGTVRATAVDGSEDETVYSLAVEPKQFATRRLTVEPRYVDPPPEVVERILRERDLQAALFPVSTPVRYWRDGFVRPVPGRANSAFGRRSVFNGQPRSPHSGADFRAGTGTPIKAPNEGVVVLATNLYFSGNVVIIDHGWGLYSYFAHLSAIDVAEGDRVRRGMVVGKVGATGRVTGAHLHWTVRLNDARVDPLSLLELFPDGGGGR